jgi:hypothetical protein
MQSAAVAHGLGIRNLYSTGILGAESATAVSLYSICAGFASILATCWSKISFAISLLRISTGRMRWFIWFIIVSVNLVFASNGTIQWAQCWPIQKRWHWDMEGSCFDSIIIQNYNTFVAGEQCLSAGLGHGPTADKKRGSFLWSNGHSTGTPSVEDYLGRCHQQEGEAGCLGGDERGCHVSEYPGHSRICPAWLT